MASDRTLAASDQLFVAPIVRTPDASDQDDSSVRSVAEKQNFIPNGYFLSGTYKYNPNWPFAKYGAKESYQGC